MTLEEKDPHNTSQNDIPPLMPGPKTSDFMRRGDQERRLLLVYWTECQGDWAGYDVRGKPVYEKYNAYTIWKEIDFVESDDDMQRWYTTAPPSQFNARVAMAVQKYMNKKKRSGWRVICQISDGTRRIFPPREGEAQPQVILIEKTKLCNCRHPERHADEGRAGCGLEHWKRAQSSSLPGSLSLSSSEQKPAGHASNSQVLDSPVTPPPRYHGTNPDQRDLTLEE